MPADWARGRYVASYRNANFRKFLKHPTKPFILGHLPAANPHCPAGISVRIWVTQIKESRLCE